MDETIIKLQAATDQAALDVEECRNKLEKSEESILKAKALLKELDESEQRRMHVTDTMLPELLGQLLMDRDAYAIAKTRYETNMRYLNQYQTVNTENLRKKSKS